MELADSLRRGGLDERLRTGGHRPAPPAPPAPAINARTGGQRQGRQQPLPIQDSPAHRLQRPPETARDRQRPRKDSTVGWAGQAQPEPGKPRTQERGSWTDRHGLDNPMISHRKPRTHLASHLDKNPPQPSDQPCTRPAWLTGTASRPSPVPNSCTTGEVFGAVPVSQDPPPRCWVHKIANTLAVLPNCAQLDGAERLVRCCTWANSPVATSAISPGSQYCQA
ncbi:hypothetical protein A8926_4023 [Saccharopolyspora spinosa]|uniref:Uncharacterized protein n=1 Tax=Saccharopolyspora spinosa TaxID=60894 RepID=A0A2N3XZV9_SACSN|nr:hypothetical protein A8926_4023 [Saccharopolyspora spinosa]